MFYTRSQTSHDVRREVHQVFIWLHELKTNDLSMCYIARLFWSQHMITAPALSPNPSHSIHPTHLHMTTSSHCTHPNLTKIHIQQRKTQCALCANRLRSPQNWNPFHVRAPKNTMVTIPRTILSPKSMTSAGENAETH